MISDGRLETRLKQQKWQPGPSGTGVATSGATPTNVLTITGNQTTWRQCLQVRTKEESSSSDYALEMRVQFRPRAAMCAVELNPHDQTAIGIVAQMDELFEIDAQGARTSIKPRGSSALAAGEIQVAARGDQVLDPGSTHERTAKKRSG